MNCFLTLASYWLWGFSLNDVSADRLPTQPNPSRDALFHGICLPHKVLCVFVHVFNVHSPPERRDWPCAALGCLMHRLHRNVCWEMIEFLFLGLIWLSRWMNICVNISRVKGVGNLLLRIVFPVGSLDLKRGCQTSTKAPQTQQEACRQIVYHLSCQGSPKEKHQLPYQGLGVPIKWWPVFPLPGRIFRESSLERFSGEGKKLATSSWFKERIKNGNVNQYFQCHTWKAAKEVSENRPMESEIR